MKCDSNTAETAQPLLRIAACVHGKFYFKNIYMNYAITILGKHLELLQGKIFVLNSGYTQKQMTDDWYRRRFNDLQTKILNINEAINILKEK